MSRRSNCWSSGKGPGVFSGVSEHVPSASNAAAVKGDCADDATVVTAATARVDGAAAAAVVAEPADDADVDDVDGAPAVSAVGTDPAEDADGDELEHAAPARPSTATPPMRRNVRRFAMAGRLSGVGDLVMVQSNTGWFAFTQVLVENKLRTLRRPTT